MKAVVIGRDVAALVAARDLARGGVGVTLVGYRAPPASAAAAAPGANAQSRRWASVILPDGRRLDLTGDIGVTAEAIDALSPHDGDAWPRFCERMHANAAVLGDLYRAPPPDPLTHDARGLVDLARGAWRLRKLGRTGMDDFLRVLPMSIADLLNDTFENDALKGVLGALGVTSLAQGPRSGGTAFNFVHHHVGSPPGVFRAAPRVTPDDAADVSRVDGEVSRIDVRDGRVAGVALTGGETIACDAVVSAFDPERTLIGLSDPGLLDPELVRSVRNIRSRGVAALVTLSIASAPDFEHLVVARSLDHIERAYDDSKYGRMSSDPFVEARYLGSAGDASHRIELQVQYVPYALREGAWNDDKRDELARAALTAIDAAIPGFSQRVVSRSVLTPFDLEQRHGWPRGQRHHAEVALDQMLWMRPIADLAHYRTPIRGLYLCGPAMHPGIPELTGANAASVILRDQKNKTF